MAKGKLALGALIGAAAGFVAGVLTAPKSGKETREDLKDAAEKAKTTAVEEAEKAKKVATEKSQEVMEKAEVVAKDVKEKAGEVSEEVVERATEYKARAEQAIEGAKKGFAKDPNSKK